MTALTGETGAGKTMLVEALELLVGGKADAALVRPGQRRGHDRGSLHRRRRRARARADRSRGRAVARLRERTAGAGVGTRGVGRATRRSARATRAPVVVVARGATRRARSLRRDRPHRVGRGASELARIEALLAELGGDERSRARELDLVRFQVGRARRRRAVGSGRGRPVVRRGGRARQRASASGGGGHRGRCARGRGRRRRRARRRVGHARRPGALQRDRATAARPRPPS